MKRHLLLLLMLLAFANVAGLGAARAQPYYGELRFVAFNWCPSGWLPAAGQTLSPNQYSPLYSLIANTFGGNYPQTFKLPDMRGLVPTGSSVAGNPAFAVQWPKTYGIPANPVAVTGPSSGALSGQMTGTIVGAVRSTSNFTATGTGSATLTAQNLPAHTHQLMASSAAGTANSPGGALTPTLPVASKLYAASTAPADTTMSANAVGPNTSTAPTPVPITVSVPVNQLTALISIPYTASPNYFSVAVNLNAQTQAPSLAANWCICAENGYCLYPQRD